MTQASSGRKSGVVTLPGSIEPGQRSARRPWRSPRVQSDPSRLLYFRAVRAFLSTARDGCTTTAPELPTIDTHRAPCRPLRSRADVALPKLRRGAPALWTDAVTAAARTFAVQKAAESGPAYQARHGFRQRGAFPLAGAICGTPLRSRVRRFESYWGRPEPDYEIPPLTWARRILPCRREPDAPCQEWT